MIDPVGELERGPTPCGCLILVLGVIFFWALLGFALTVAFGRFP